MIKFKKLRKKRIENMKKFSKFGFLLLPIAYCLLPHSLFAQEKTVINKTIAIVNGEAILLSELEKNVQPLIEQYKLLTPPGEQTTEKIRQLKKDVLNQMIDEKLLLQEAKKRKILVTKREIEEGVNEVKKRFPAPEDFQTELKKQFLTKTDFEKRIQEQLMVIKFIDLEIKAKVPAPREEETKKIYEKIVNQIEGKKDPKLTTEEENEIISLARFFERRTAERVRVRHILIRLEKKISLREKTAALNRIKEIQQRVKAGENFSELAQKYSEDPGSKEQGGDLGFFVHGDMVPEFEKVAFSLPVGEVSDIVETDFGYHLIKCEEKKAKSKLTYNEMKEELQEYLYRSKAEGIYQDFLKQLRSNATIKISEIE